METSNCIYYNELFVVVCFVIMSTFIQDMLNRLERCRTVVFNPGLKATAVENALNILLD